MLAAWSSSETNQSVGRAESHIIQSTFSAPYSSLTSAHLSGHSRLVHADRKCGPPSNVEALCPDRKDANSIQAYTKAASDQGVAKHIGEVLTGWCRTVEALLKESVMTQSQVRPSRQAAFDKKGFCTRQAKCLNGERGVWTLEKCMLCLSHKYPSDLCQQPSEVAAAIIHPVRGSLHVSLQTLKGWTCNLRRTGAAKPKPRCPSGMVAWPSSPSHPH